MMYKKIKNIIKLTPLLYFYIKLKRIWTAPTSQNDEHLIIDRLIKRYNIPKTFIEFGFSGWEFNCAKLVEDWDGFLVDGDDYNVKIGKTLYGVNIEIKKIWLTINNLHIFKNWIKDRELGILSIDVDGNDYWFLEQLILLKPALIISEYNSSFGLKPISVQYDEEFDGRLKHPTWTYYGASLVALNHLANNNGYSLIEISNSGVNAFFIRNDYLTHHDIVFNPEHVYREKVFADGSRPNDQFERIKHLPFIDVTTNTNFRMETI